MDRLKGISMYFPEWGTHSQMCDEFSLLFFFDVKYLNVGCANANKIGRQVDPGE